MGRIAGILLTCLWWTTLTAQPLEVSRATLKKIFKDAARGTAFGWNKNDHDSGSNLAHKSKYECWLTQNTDSAYYLSDTIRFYNNQYAYFDIEGDVHFEWILVKNRDAYYADVSYNEPPTAQVHALTYRWKIEQDKSGTYIRMTERKSKTEELFKVFSLELTSLSDKEKGYVMDVERIK